MPSAPCNASLMAHAFELYRRSGITRYTLEEGGLRERQERTGEERLVPFDRIRRIGLDRMGGVRTAYVGLHGGPEIVIRSVTFPGVLPRDDRRATFEPLVRALLTSTTQRRSDVELRTVARGYFVIGVVLAILASIVAAIGAHALFTHPELATLERVAFVLLALLGPSLLLIWRGRGRRFTVDRLPEGYFEYGPATRRSGSARS